LRRDARERKRSFIDNGLVIKGDSVERLRITNDLLDKKRQSRTGRILVTGGTGFLGSHIVAKLLAEGHPTTVLVRPNGSLSAQQRVDSLMEWLGLDGAAYPRLDIVQGDLDRPNLGLSSSLYLSLLDGVSEIIHCASETSFSERKRALVERTNIDGMRAILDLAGKGRCVFFHYVSTAYAAGKKPGICREELAENDAFTNVYEETKHRAERMAAEHCRREGIRLAIYRPSIVYGDSQTGRSSRFNALYYPVRTLSYLRDLYHADIRERGGKQAEEMGVKLTDDGTIFLPIRVAVAENGGVNLIPIDYFADAFMAIRGACLDGGVFHIVNRRLNRIEELIDYTKRFLGIAGLEPCNGAAGEQKNALQILFDGYLDVYGPYMRDTRMFEDRYAQAILAGKGIVCPAFDFAIFSRCMAYAVACGWGRRAGINPGKENR
jgi:nucleoside-diphosphate-sugar epimerase